METCRTRKLTQLIDLYFYCFVMYTINVFQWKSFLLKFLFSFLLQYQSLLVLSSRSKESCQDFAEPLIRFIADQLCFVLIVSLSESLSAISLTGAAPYFHFYCYSLLFSPQSIYCPRAVSVNCWMQCRIVFYFSVNTPTCCFTDGGRFNKL